MLRRFRRLEQPSPMTMYGAGMMLNFLNKKFRAFQRAKEFADGKGIANIGAGCDRSFISRRFCNDSQVVANIDIAGYGPNFYRIDLEEGSLPFQDKQFGCVFASHVLEHLGNWEVALDEWSRIADHVVIAIPHPMSIGGYVSPEHRQHFSFRNKQYIEARWPSVEIYM